MASSSTTVFVSPANNVNSENNKCKTEIVSENIDKGKSILGAPPKVEKKETRNPRTKKVNNKKSQPKKLHLCHHCGVSRHNRTSLRTFRNVAFIWSAMLFFWTFPTLLYLVSLGLVARILLWRNP